MKNYYESLKVITSQVCRGLQKLIGYEPLHPKGAMQHVVDRGIPRDSNETVGFPTEFARIVREIYHPEQRQKTGQWTNAIGMTFAPKPESLDYQI